MQIINQKRTVIWEQGTRVRVSRRAGRRIRKDETNPPQTTLSSVLPLERSNHLLLICTRKEKPETSRSWYPDGEAYGNGAQLDEGISDLGSRWGGSRPRYHLRLLHDASSAISRLAPWIRRSVSAAEQHEDEEGMGKADRSRDRTSFEERRLCFVPSKRPKSSFHLLPNFTPRILVPPLKIKIYNIYMYETALK